ncbi:MAG: transporter substrate-binding domain-containing protein [Nitrospiraceae bacterium]|nr:MAG: transporter substrate-binding domain-containing protein [Nitrospiraceae bacterium]
MVLFRRVTWHFSGNNYAFTVIVAALVLICLHNIAYAQKKELLVATKEAPPFSMKTDDGTWSGVSIALWKEIAGELDLKYRFIETDLQGMLDGLKEGRYDAAVAALTVTEERETVFDFTHPFYTTGLGIAVQQVHESWTAVVKRFFSSAFLKVILLLAVILLIFGFLVWLLEKRKNPEQFSNSVKGIGDGFWWAAVTMTTVGYGDKAPKTLAGRIIATIWMFTAIIIISSFTASITSSLTVSQLGSAIKGPEDLPGHRVASIKGSTSERYLTSHRITYVNFANIEEGLKAVVDGKVDCMVYDAPLLKYYIARDKYKLSVVKRVFEQQYYAFGLIQNSPLRENINRVLLEKTELPWWQDTLFQYIGK